jgi:molybdopterin/thiamine biosynthesis adenylyltransferase
VPGIIGCIQALEAIKIIAKSGCNSYEFFDIRDDLISIVAPLSQKLLLFDALNCQFRTIKIRPRNKDCNVCGDNPSIRELIDYELFCNAKPNDKARYYLAYDIII